MSDFVLILSLLYCWLFNDSALFLGVASEKDKATSWFHGKLNQGLRKHQEVCFTPMTKVEKLIVIFCDLFDTI